MNVPYWIFFVLIYAALARFLFHHELFAAPENAFYQTQFLAALLLAAAPALSIGWRNQSLARKLHIARGEVPDIPLDLSNVHFRSVDPSNNDLPLPGETVIMGWMRGRELQKVSHGWRLKDTWHDSIGGVCEIPPNVWFPVPRNPHT